MKKINQIEYIVKGFSNKTRINIIFILSKRSELSVGQIANYFNKDYKTVSHHLQKMMATGIVMKRNSGKEVRHALTEKGKVIFKFLEKI